MFSLGLDIGPEHQRIVEVLVQGNQADVAIDGTGIDFAQFAIPGGLLDSLFQAGAFPSSIHMLEVHGDIKAAFFKKPLNSFKSICCMNI